MLKVDIAEEMAMLIASLRSMERRASDAMARRAREFSWNFAK
jgi:hypothetical protein